MPQEAVLKQTSRTQVDPYELRRQNIHPQYEVGNAVSAPFTPVGESANLKSLAATLTETTKGLSSFTTLQEAQKPGNQLAAQQAQANFATQNPESAGLSADEVRAAGGDTGKPNGPLNMGVGFDDAWNFSAGKNVGSGDFQTELSQLHQEQGNLPPDQFQGEVQKLKGKYLQQMQNPHQAAGFLSEANALGDQYNRVQLAQWNTEQQKKIDNNISESANTDISGSIQTQLGILSLDKLQDVTWRTNYENNLGSPAGIAQAQLMVDNLHGLYEHGMQDAIAQGKTPSQYRALFLDKVSQVAILNGMPELLDFAKIKDKGGDNVGNSIMDEYGDKVIKGLLEATEMKNRMQKTIDAANAEATQKANAEWAMGIKNQVSDLINVTDDPNKFTKLAALQAAWRKDAAAHGVTMGENDSFNTMVNSLTAKDGFAAADKSEILADLLTRGSRLRQHDVNAAMGQLTKQSFEMLTNRVLHYEDQAQNRADNRQQQRENHAFDLALESIKQRYKVPDELSAIASPDEKQALSNALSNTAAWMQTHPGAKATDLLKYMNGDLKSQVEPPKSIYAGSGQPSPAGASSTPSAPQKSTAAPSLPAGAITGNYHGTPAYRIGQMVYDMKGKRLN